MLLFSLNFISLVKLSNACFWDKYVKFFIPDGLIIIETVIGGNKVPLTDPVLKVESLA